MINMIPFASGSYPSSGASAKYKCFATYNCPHTATGKSNINPTLEQYKIIMAAKTQVEENDEKHKLEVILKGQLDLLDKNKSNYFPKTEVYGFLRVHQNADHT